MEGSATVCWKEFPEGDRAAVAAHEKVPGEFIGIKTFQVGPFCGGRELDKEEVKKEYSSLLLHTKAPREGSSLQGSQVRAETALWPALSPPGLAAWASGIEHGLLWLWGPFCLHLFAPCIGTYCLAVNLASLIATFAYRPSSMLLRCLLSLFAPRLSRFKSFLDILGVAPISAVVPDSLVAALPFLFFGSQLIVKDDSLDSILESVGQDRGDQADRERQQQEEDGGEGWRMWEEVNCWRKAAGNAWPTLEAHDAPLLRGAGRGACGGDEEVVVECCEGMRLAMRKNRAIAAARKEALIAMVIAAGDPGASGVNPLACLREMLLGGTSYCPQAKVDAVTALAAAGGDVASVAAAAAASTAAVVAPQDRGGAEMQKGKGWPHGCASPRCSKVEGAGVQLKLCSRCGKAAYCSRECQKADWPSHKLTCQPKGKEKTGDKLLDVVGRLAKASAGAPPTDANQPEVDQPDVNQPAPEREPADKQIASYEINMALNNETAAATIVSTSTLHVPVAGSSGLSVQDKIQSSQLATMAEQQFLEDDSDEESDIDIAKDDAFRLRYTAIFLIPMVLSQEIIAIIDAVRLLMQKVWCSSLTPNAGVTENIQEMTPGFVAKTRFCRLQISFLDERDAHHIKSHVFE
ncbi:unnamed protein product [Closterium sp. NIES-53]